MKWRCQFHLAQNAIYHAPNAAIRKRIGAELRRIWNASSLQTAQEELDRLITAYRGMADRLADWLEHNVPEGLAVFTLPEQSARWARRALPSIVRFRADQDRPAAIRADAASRPGSA